MFCFVRASHQKVQRNVFFFLNAYRSKRYATVSWPRGKVQMTIISCNLVQTMIKEEGELAAVLGLLGPTNPYLIRVKYMAPSPAGIFQPINMLSCKPYFVPANQHSNLFNQSACFLINRTLFQPINTQTYSTNQHSFL